MKSEYQLKLPLQDENKVEGEAKAVLEKAKKQTGFIPNMYAGMVNSPGLLNTYLDGYQAFREQSGFSGPEQETVFLAISYENGCDYCMSAHSMLGEQASGLDKAHIEALRDGKALADKKLNALAEFVRIMVQSRGLPTADQARSFLEAGYTENHMLEVVLAIAVKTLSNYSNHLLHTPLDEAFASWAWKD